MDITSEDYPTKPIESLTEVQKFYSGSKVLVTGGTGFLGKILVEKLLRSCQVSTIFLLVRAKKGKHVHSRCEELFEDVVFDQVKKICPKFQHRVQAISGDASLPELGLSAVDRKLLTSEVNIVFHAAATVRFDEKLRLATAINVKGCREMLNLCKEMPNLKAIIHVSTAFANCPWKHIEEKFYPASMDYDKLISITDAADDKQLENMTKSLTNGWPNTYSFTKAIAEDLVRRESGGLPTGVFRPSIVVSTYREPIKGWVDNLYGATGVCAGAGVGILRTLHCDPAAIANITPVDTTVNALICSAWDVAKKSNTVDRPSKRILENGPRDDIPVYNYVSTADNSLSWDKFMKLCAESGVKYPSVKAVWYFSLTLNKYWAIHWLYVILFHLLPGLLVDTVLVCTGKRPKMLRVYKNIIKYNSAIAHFCLNTWTFSYDNVVNLWENLEERDKEEYFFDMRKLQWKTFFKEHMLGVRLYLLKDDISTLPQAAIRWKLYYWLHQLAKLALLVFFLRFVWLIVQLIFF